MGTPKGTKPWNAGTGKGWVDSRGYRWQYVEEGGRRVARREHRLAMERHLGRRLEPWELVHHKDDNKANNDISNLEIREFGEHTAEHSRGRRHSQDAKRSMEVFALMREELRRERAVKAELLEATEAAVDILESYVGFLHRMPVEDIELHPYIPTVEEACDKARAALARARGQ